MVTAARLTAVIVFRTGSRHLTRPANELSLSCQQGFGLASMFEECAEAKTIVQRFELDKWYEADPVSSSLFGDASRLATFLKNTGRPSVIRTAVGIYSGHAGDSHTRVIGLAGPSATMSSFPTTRNMVGPSALKPASENRLRLAGWSAEPSTGRKVRRATLPPQRDDSPAPSARLGWSGVRSPPDELRRAGRERATDSAARARKPWDEKSAHFWYKEKEVVEATLAREREAAETALAREREAAETARNTLADEKAAELDAAIAELRAANDALRGELASLRGTFDARLDARVERVMAASTTLAVDRGARARQLVVENARLSEIEGKYLAQQQYFPREDWEQPTGAEQAGAHRYVWKAERIRKAGGRWRFDHKQT